MSTHHPQGSVPKFASFKPKPQAQDADVAAENKNRDTGARDHRDVRHHHKRHKSRSPQRSKAITKDQVSQPEEPKASDLFLVDRKGDVQNLVYGGIHKYSIPPFHRFGAGNVLGAHKVLKIDRGAADGDAIVLNDGSDKTSRKREKYAFARSEKNPPKLLRLLPQPAGQDHLADGADFIPLRISRRRGSDDGGEDSGSDDSRRHYRSIEGKAAAEDHPEDNDLEYATESDSSGSDSGRNLKYDDNTKKKTIELSRRAEQYPQNIEAWIDLINHQDDLLGLADDGRRKVTSAERSSIADIKIYLYEKALKNVESSLSNRERLLVGLMREGSKIWTFQIQSERWEKIAQENLDSLLLGKHYLDFRQSSFPTFRYEDVRDIYSQRITLLIATMNRAIALGDRSNALWTQFLYTILRATLMMREAGYSEIAAAVWQALLEYNLYCPTNIPVSSRMELFREFWESDVPRIGDHGARGWNGFLIQQEGVGDTSTDSLGPWRTAEAPPAVISETTEDEEDDPYGVVLWSDVEGFIFGNHDNPPNLIHGQLIDTFLIFCRLPPLVPLQQSSRIWMEDAYIRGEMLEWNTSWLESQLPFAKTPTLQLSSGNSGIDVPERAVADASFPQSNHAFIPTVETLLASSHWVNSFVPWNKMYSKAEVESKHQYEGPVKYSWLLNILRRLVLTDSSESLSEYYVAFEWHNEPQAVKKTAKYLLKRHPGSIRLYNAYAMIEWLRGSKDLAQNVITSALSIRNSSLGTSDGAIILWKTRVWWFLEDNDHAAALTSILAIPDSPNNTTADTSSPALILKAKQFLTSARDGLLSTNISIAIIYAELLLLLAYLTTDLESSITNVFTPFSTTLISRETKLSPSPALELFHQTAARLLHHHIQSKRSYRPSFISSHLEHSLSLFPSNTIFLALHHSIASRLSFPMPALNLHTSQSPTALTTHLLLIRQSLRASYQNPHSTLAAFENAVSDPECASNAGLWRVYVLFCASLRGGEKRKGGKRTAKWEGKAREVFWRGLRACPWARQLYMLALRDDADMGMSEEEKRAVWRVMIEKELRGDEAMEERFDGGAREVLGSEDAGDVKLMRR